MQFEIALAKYPVQGKKVVTSRPPSWRGLRLEYTTALVDPDGSGSPRGGAFEDGVAVAEVEEGKPAWLSGLRPGMIIRQVDRTPVHSPGEFHAAVRGQAGPVLLRLAPAYQGQGDSLVSVGPGP